MQTNFKIETRTKDGNLHVQAQGDFNGSTAMQLIHTLHRNYKGKGKVYIETNRLRDVCPFGCRTFACRLDKHKLPVERLIYKGRNGPMIAPEGSTVITTPPKHKCGCDGNCRNCPCSQKNAAVKDNVRQ